MSDILNQFGDVLMTRVRDKAINDWEKLINGEMRGQTANALRQELQSFSTEQLQIVLALLPRIVDTTLHHLLWTVEQDPGFEIWVKGAEGAKNLREESDGLPGEMEGPKGWIARFSKKAEER